MAKARRMRRRIRSQRLRAKPYKVPSSNRLAARNMFAENCTKCLEKRDWENVICSVCMECPHNAVLLLCSSHDKGCRPYMCGTSFRYSNCLDQYKKASAKLKSSNHQTNKSGNLTCPLCRGQVKGWTIVQPARDYLNLKKRICMQEKCVFAGTFKELRKHMKIEHPFAQPREVDPEVEQNWRRLEMERDMDDVMSSISSATPGSMVLGNYIIETNNGSDSGEGDAHYGDGGIDAGLGRSLVNLFLFLNAFEASGNQTSRSDSDSNDLTTYHGRSEINVSGVEEENIEERYSNILASVRGQQGRILLGRSGRRRSNREANQRPGPPR